MYIAVRCPDCLLTVYTTYVDDGGTKAFTVVSLDDEDIPFFNCPMPLCKYHTSILHFINLYRNSTPDHPMSVSHGLSVAPRTADTRPFRTLEQAADLAITLDNAAVEAAAQCEQPPVTALQFVDMAQITKEQTVQEETIQQQTFQEQSFQDLIVQEQTVQQQNFQEQSFQEPTVQEQSVQEPTVQEPSFQEPSFQEQSLQQQNFQQQQPVQQQASQETAHEDSQVGAAAVFSVIDTRIPPRKWTDEEVEKLVSMHSQGIQQKKIAAKLNRTVVSIQRKLFAIAKLAKEEI